MADNINTRTTESVPYSMARSTIEDLSPRNGSDDGLGSLSAVRLTGPCGDGDHVTLTEKHKTMRLDLELSGRRRRRSRKQPIGPYEGLLRPFACGQRCAAADSMRRTTAPGREIITK